MEQFEFNYPAKRKVAKRAHVGVAGSGDLEVLLEAKDDSTASVRIRTSVGGFKNTWKAVLDRFFGQYGAASTSRSMTREPLQVLHSCDSNKRWKRLKYE